jgi:hypothetical protein
MNIEKVLQAPIIFFPQIGTGVYHWNPPTKEESMQWVHNRAGPIPEFQIPILQINASEILFHLFFTSQCKYHVKTIILELD